MKKEKLKQLKVVFKAIIKEGLYTNYHGIKTNYPINQDENIENVINKLVYEVKIRINNK